MGIAQPTTYRSASGAYSLHVDPHDRMGKTSANYRFLKGDNELWSGEKEYTLRAVKVTDAGAVVGIAYRGKDFHIIILDGDGRELLNEVAHRHRVHHSTSEPFAEQILADPEHDRLIVRVRGREDRCSQSGAFWQLYRLSTGEPQESFNPLDRMPDSDDAKYVVDAQLVPGTPLLLVHWYTRGPDYEVKDAGGRFTLVGSDGRPVWSLDAKDDYVGVDFRRRRYGGGPLDYFRQHPAILRADEAHRFDLRLLAENHRVSFVIERKADDEWFVSEVGRKAYEEPQVATDSRIGEPKGSLEYLGELDLGVGYGQSSPFRTILDFTFDGTGRIYFWRRGSEGENTLVQVDPKTGEAMIERPFDELEDRFCLQWTDTPRVKESRFIVWHRGPGAAHLVELETGDETWLEAYPRGSVRPISRFADGSFVVLESGNRNYVAAYRLLCYGADGKLRWQVPAGDRDSEAFAGPTRDVVVSTDGRVFVLTMMSVEIVDRLGKHLKRIDLTGAFGREEFGGRPLYVHEIVADGDGGFLIADSGNPPVVLRYKADGSVRSRWSPRHPDGRTFDIRPGVRVAPNGRLWTSDGESIMRLTDEGVVDLVFGEAPDPDTLGEVAGLTVAPDGRIYAVAKRSGGIHVHSPTGELERIDAPEPTDFAGTVREAFIVATDHGDYYVERPARRVYAAPDEYLHFSATGERMGVVTFEPHFRTTRFGPGWVFQPSTGYRCGFAGIGTLTIVDPPSTVIREIKKQSNGKWYSFVSSFAMAPDGTMAVLSCDLGEDIKRCEVDLRSANGDPIRTISLPLAAKRFTGLAYYGERVVVVGNEEILIVNTSDDSVERWALADVGDGPGIAKRSWQPYITAGGRELLLHEEKSGYQAPTIHRYRLP